MRMDLGAWADRYASARKLTGLIVGTAALASCVSMDPVQSHDLPVFSAADEALYAARFKRLAEGGSGGSGLGEYDTLEPVAGAKSPYMFPAAANRTLSAKALSEAREYARRRNSLAFLVYRGGAVEEEQYFGDTTSDTLINSRSLAKPLTAIIVGRAIAQGYIKSLDQPVSDFITEWRGDSLRERILIRHLLDMRSGFLPQAFATSPEDVLNRAYLHPRHDDVIIREMPVVNDPGSRYEYANATSEMVAPVIERATGKRYAEYLSEAVLRPIDAAGGQIWVNREGGTAHSGCCLLMPARSWLSLGVLLLHDGVWEGRRLLPEGYVAAMRTATGENPHYGLGLWLPGPYVERRGFAHPSVEAGRVLHSEPYLDRNLFLFDGNGNQVAYMIPSQDMVIMRLGNRPPADAEWDNAYIPNLLIRDAHRISDEPLPEPQAR